MKLEQQFERNLKQISPYFNMFYVKIPDTKMLNKHNRTRNKEEKRAFDGILITEHGNIAIECKANYNRLEPHQLEYLKAIYEKNGLAFVLRKKQLKMHVVYTCEMWSGQVLFAEISLEKFILTLKKYLDTKKGNEFIDIEIKEEK